MAVGVRAEQERKRPAARTTASRARRCLFGPPTDAELTAAMSDYREHERRIDDEKQRQWNFDFRRMTPLPGRWEWEALTPQQTPPGSLAVDRDPDDASPTATCGPPTDDVSPPAVNSGTASTTTTSSNITATSGATPRRKRRQTTINGSALPYDSFVTCYFYTNKNDIEYDCVTRSYSTSKAYRTGSGLKLVILVEVVLTGTDKRVNREMSRNFISLSS